MACMCQPASCSNHSTHDVRVGPVQLMAVAELLMVTAELAVLPLYTFLKVLYFFKEKLLVILFYTFFSGVNTFLYFFFAKNGKSGN